MSASPHVECRRSLPWGRTRAVHIEGSRDLLLATVRQPGRRRPQCSRPPDLLVPARPERTDGATPGDDATLACGRSVGGAGGVDDDGSQSRRRRTMPRTRRKRQRVGSAPSAQERRSSRGTPHALRAPGEGEFTGAAGPLTLPATGGIGVESMAGVLRGAALMLCGFARVYDEGLKLIKTKGRTL